MKEERAIDLDRAMSEFDSDREFLKELLGGFLCRVREQIETIRTALEEGNADLVRKEAHSIRGGAANICAGKLSLAAFELENAGKSGALGRGREMLGELRRELERLEDYARSEL